MMVSNIQPSHQQLLIITVLLFCGCAHSAPPNEGVATICEVCVLL